jgi:hypothetical protein
MSKTTAVLRKHALRHADVEEGVACEGTPLERRTVKAKKKAFVFLGLSDVMLKLRDSLVEASKLASKSPGLLRVGANGWVKVEDARALPLSTLSRWIDESYVLVAGATGTPTRTRRKRTKQKTSKAPKKRAKKPSR